MKDLGLASTVVYSIVLDSGHTKEADMAARGQRKCSDCGQFKADVKVVEDPYAAEIDDRHVSIKVCNDCYDQLLLEI